MRPMRTGPQSGIVQPQSSSSPERAGAETVAIDACPWPWANVPFIRWLPATSSRNRCPAPAVPQRTSRGAGKNDTSPVLERL